MLEVSDLTFTYPSSNDATLRKLNLKLERGDFVLLSGLTGSGKSTLLLALSGLLDRLSSGKLTGTIELDRRSIDRFQNLELCQKVALLHQNPEEQIFCTVVEDEIAFALENIATPPEELDRRIDEILQSMGLHNFRKRKISQLSTGEKQLVTLASLCLLGPEILLLDEPTTHLDRIHSRKVLQILRRLNREMRMTVVIATHQVGEIDRFCNKFWTMENGKIKVSESPIAMEMVKNFNGEKTIDFPATFLSRKTENSRLAVQNLSFRYSKELPHLLKNLSFSIEKNEIVALVGENGSGKTTLLMLLAGLLRASSGKILFDGRPIGGGKLRNFVGKVALVFQNPDLMLQTKSVEEEILFGLRRPKSETSQNRLSQLLKLFDLEPFRKINPHALSSGERQRVAIAAAIAPMPPLLLLDEPSAAQDFAHLDRLMSAVVGLAKTENMSLIFSTHGGHQLTRKYADRILSLREATF